MSNAVASGLAGAGGGMIAQIITYPLQTVNTRQQTERRAKKDLANSSRSAASSATLLQILQVIRTEGWGGLYSGLKPSLLGTAASQGAEELTSAQLLFFSVFVSSLQDGIYYYFYQVFKNKAEAIAAARRDKGRGDGTVGMFSWLVVAAIAGSLNVLLTNPIWVLVTRMQTHTQVERKIMEEIKEDLLREASESRLTYSTLQDKLAELDSLKPRPYGTMYAVREVYAEAGITGFWKGIIPTLIMAAYVRDDIPLKKGKKEACSAKLYRHRVCNPSIQFMIYESSLKHLRAKRAANKQGLKNVTALEVFLLGALAKLGATVSTYPLLVVKSRLQAKQEIGGNFSLRYSGTFDAIIKMIRYEGLPGFYKGMSTKIVQSVFAASVLFVVKEELVKAYMLLEYKCQKVMLNLWK